MKRALYLILIAALAACQRPPRLSETLAAAGEVYNQFADREELTVALVGYQQPDGDTVTAVMIQAQSLEAWNALLLEQGLPQQTDSSARVSSAAVGYFHADTIRETMDSLAMRVSHDPALTIPLSSSSRTEVTRQRWVNGKKVMDTTIVTNGLPQCRKPHLIETARNHGQKGYVMYTDGDGMTLWLFFYGNLHQYHFVMGKLNRLPE